MLPGIVSFALSPILGEPVTVHSSGPWATIALFSFWLGRVWLLAVGAMAPEHADQGGLRGFDLLEAFLVLGGVVGSWAQSGGGWRGVQPGFGSGVFSLGHHILGVPPSHLRRIEARSRERV